MRRLLNWILLWLGCAASVGAQAGKVDCARILAEMRTDAGDEAATSETTLPEGICLCRAAKWGAASEKLRPLADAQPSNAAASYWFGLAQLYLKNFDAARVAMLRAVTLTPTSAEGFRALGEIELELRHNDAAYRAWLKASELDPHDVRTLYYIGRLFFEADFLDEAAAWFRKALEIDKTHFASMTYLAMCAERLDFTPVALALYRRAIVESKRQGMPYAWAYLNLAKHYREGGEDAEAIKLLEEAEHICPEAHALTALAQLVAADDSARAEALLRRAIALDASLPDAHYRLSLLLRAADKAQAAQNEMDLFQATKDIAERNKHAVQAIRKGAGR